MAEKRAFLFVNGEMRDARAVRALIQPGDFLAAADGGLRHMQAMGLTPGLLIGDLDSVEPEDVERMREQGVHVERYPVEKDETDLELAMRSLLQKGFTRIYIVAALGGRLDQTLGNLFLLSAPELDVVDVRLVDGLEEVFLVRGEVTIHGRAGEIVSLLAIGEPARGVETEGLYYPLRGETLWPHKTRGISNVMTGEQARVRLQAGQLLCIHTHKVEETEE